MDIDDAFRQEVELFLNETGVADSTFGRLALGDWKFVTRIRAGEDFRLSTVMRVKGFMAGYRAGLEARNVERPPSAA